jgi:hypothetical protein
VRADAHASTLERRMNRRDLIRSAVALALPGAAGAAEPRSRVSEERIHGRHALVIQNRLMRLGVLTGGGFIAEARLASADPLAAVNPMRVPHYRTIDPYTYDIARHGALYGTGIQRRLMSGYMGQFTCFPHFAASSPAEFAQDYGQHGELITVRWGHARGGPDELVMTADLPMTQYAFERRVVLPADETVAYITETAENLVRYDRAAQWVEHTAFGPPFVQLDRTLADGSVDKVVLGRGPTARTTDFPIGVDAQGGRVDYRPFRGATSLWLMQRSGKYNWFTLYNAEMKLLIGYLYEAEGNPWLLDYQENMRVTEVPWDGKVVMRGPCFGDSVTSGLRNAVTQGSMLGVPTYSWFEARARRSKRYAIFLAEVPVGFQGVADLTAASGAIAFVERGAGRRTTLKASRLW